MTPSIELSKQAILLLEGGKRSAPPLKPTRCSILVEQFSGLKIFEFKIEWLEI